MALARADRGLHSARAHPTPAERRGADPYALIQKLGGAFNNRVNLHIDACAPSYSSDDDAMEFMMPVRPRPTSPAA